MTKDVQRLPVQHRNHPRCTECERDLPTFDNVAFMLPGDDRVVLIAVTFHIVCECGRRWDVRKDSLK